MSPCACSPQLYHRMGETGRSKLETVCNFGCAHLSSLTRRSGESYATHGCEVAATLRELTDDPSLLSVAILHDILVHEEGESLLARAPLSDEEQSLIRHMHELRRLHIDANTMDLDRTLDAFTGDARLLPLRMAHRLNDVRHLHRFPKKLQRQIAHETLHMYSAIAGRLGMHRWRYEMEDVSFRLLQPRIVSNLEKTIEGHRALDIACLEHTRDYLREKLIEEGIEVSIDFRIKSLYSTYRKMLLKRRSFEELLDRLALRIVVPSTGLCYAALGIVHASLHPVPGKLKDYIGAPKENGYRSIHTVVYPLPGVTEQPIEIQIRTKEMQEECEYGIAKHGEYKNALYALHTRSSRVNLFRNLQNLREEARSPKQFETALRTYFREDHIALFDAGNTLYHLKHPASALDFLVELHGKRCKFLKTVRINGRERPIDTLLHDGDTVDALFQRESSAKASWVHACKHPASRRLLREILRA